MWGVSLTSKIGQSRSYLWGVSLVTPYSAWILIKYYKWQYLVVGHCMGVKYYPAVIDFLQKMKVTVMVPNHGGDPVGSILGPMGPIGPKKWVKTVKNYHAPKVEFPTTPRSSIFPKKIEVTVMAQNYGGDSLGSILGPMEFYWVKKEWVQSVTNYHAPKIRIFDYPAIIHFS